MFAVARCELFVLHNGLLKRFEPANRPKVVYGLSEYFAHDYQREHCLVVDALDAFKGLKPSPPISVGDDIDWQAISDYVNSPVKALPRYQRVKFDMVAELIAEAEVKDSKSHALSAMLSNFRADTRNEIKQLVINFLLDTKVPRFELPEHLRPKRGRAVTYYNNATETDYTDLKRSILSKSGTTFESRYWISVIEKEKSGQ